MLVRAWGSEPVAVGAGFYDVGFVADGNAAEDDPWMQCALRPLHVVNQLLATAGSPYRVMVFEPGAPDTTVFLAPQDILQLIPTQPNPNSQTSPSPNHETVPRVCQDYG
jgi:hypothetical protein